MQEYPGNKRYHTLDYHLKQIFGTKVIKIALNAGFTCPNIDGTCSTGGCTYCSSSGSGEFAGCSLDSIPEQFEQGKQLLQHKWPMAKYIAYFQAHTNTYASLTTLQEKYETALRIKDVVGIAIATRADCLAEDVLDYLAELNQRTYLSVELGLQTIHNITAHTINRGYDYDIFEKAVWALHKRHIPICVHIINGLPGETKEMMLETVRVLSHLPISSIKIHLLYILNNTQMGNEYRKAPFPLLSQEEYISIVCDQLELLPQTVVIERLTGDGARNELIAPLWSSNKKAVRNGIDKELKRRESFQGKKFADAPNFLPCNKSN